MGKTIRNTIAVSGLVNNASFGQLVAYNGDLYEGTGIGKPLKRISTLYPTIIEALADTTSVQFTELDFTLHKGYTVVSYIVGGASAYNIAMYFNGIVTANKYSSQKFSSAGTANAGAKTTNGSVWGTIAANTKLWGVTEIDMLGGFPAWVSRQSQFSTDNILLTHGRLNVAQSNVTNFTLTSSITNGIKAGSIFELYPRC